MTTVGQVNLFNPILNNIDRTETKRYAGMGRSIHFPESIISEACSIVMLEKHIKTVEQACMTTAFKVLLDNNQLAYGYWAISETENLLFSVYDIN